MSIIIIFVLSPVSTYPQTKIENWRCGNTRDYTGHNLKKPIPQILKDTLKVGLLLVQFADWESNYDARGGVGWTDSFDTRAVDTFKYKYVDYWNIFFSENYYQDNDPQHPLKHPDAHSHRTAVYGSFTDYWTEASHGNLYTKAAETHPAFSEIYRTGIVNRFHSDGSVNWLTLDSVKIAYGSSETVRVLKLLDSLIFHAINKAHQLFLSGDLDVDVLDETRFDKILIQYAGTTISGFAKASDLGGTYTISSERWQVKGKTAQLIGFGIDAHEFGHLLGFYDFHGYGFGSYGVGYFSLMGHGSIVSLGRMSPAHLDPWHKLRMGWIDYDIIEHDTSGISLTPIEGSSPKVYILKGSGNPGKGSWDEKNLDYFILENRSILGFDRVLNAQANISEFNGGLVIWHCAGKYPFTPSPGGVLSNGFNLQIIEADNDFAISNGSDSGNPYDFYPGPAQSYIPAITDTTLPHLRLHNKRLSHNGLYGIRYREDRTVLIDSISTRAQIRVISENTTWDNVINIKNDILVTNNATLRINPGTKINISPEYGILNIVFEKGTELHANGTQSEPIIFSSGADSSNNNWQGIIMQSGSHLNVSWLTIKNAITGIDAANSDLTNQNFTGISFAYCETAFKIGTNSITFNDCSFSNCRITVNTSIALKNTIFISSKIDISNYCTGNTISLCKFTKQSIITIGVNSGAEINENTFFDNSRVWITESCPLIKNNLFIGENYSEIAILIKSIGGNANPLIINNTLMYYAFAIKQQDGLERSNPTIKNNIFYQNQYSSQLSGNITYNDFFNISNAGAPIGIDGNIFVDPDFIHLYYSDYRLSFHSLCLDKGDPDADYSHEPFPNGHRINLGHHGNTTGATESFDTIIDGIITGNTTWEGTVLVNDDILFLRTSSLRILEGTYISVRRNKLISVFCELECRASTDSIIFSVYEKSGKWDGIIISNNSELAELSLVTISNAKTGILVINSNINLNFCSFQNNGTGLIALGSSGQIATSIFTRNDLAGAYFSESNFKVISCEFVKNGLYGAYVQYGSRMDFNDNNFQGNSCSAGYENLLKGGLILYESSPVLARNKFIENYYNGLLMISMSDPVMNFKQSGFNLFYNNGDVGEDDNFAEIQCLDYSCSGMELGHNDIIEDRRGWLMYSGELSDNSTNICGNYWGINEYNLISDRLSDSFEFAPFDNFRNTEEIQETFDDELKLQPHTFPDFNIHNISTYDSIIENSDNEKEIIRALENKYYYYLNNGLKFDELYNKLMVLKSNHQFERVQLKAHKLAMRCLLVLEKFKEAVDEYNSVIETTGPGVDEVYWKIEKFWAEFKSSMVANNETYQISHVRQHINNFNDYYIKSDRLFSDRLKIKRQPNPKISQEYVLYQNYPNPFNSVTYIQFSIPQVEFVTLKIYNILGQEVTTLVEQQNSAGQHKFTFDSNGLASGAYFYTLTTSSGVYQNRKMMLVK